SSPSVATVSASHRKVLRLLWGFSFHYIVPGPSREQSLSKPAFFRQNSERRNFKLLDTRKLSRDGTGSPYKISPPSTPSSPDDTFFNLGDPQNGRKKRKIPKVRLATSFVFRYILPLPCRGRLQRSLGREPITGPLSACFVSGQGKASRLGCPGLCHNNSCGPVAFLLVSLLPA
uniref:DENN domain containing 2A n=1 Tax=Equus asinus TaxID=9793 RepID=A0A9L0JNN6_EQUAS